MSYDYRERKIIAILDEDIAFGLALNALGHMAFSAGHYSEDSWMGKKVLTDAIGNIHIGISKYPFIVLKAKKEAIKSMIQTAKEKKIFCIEYPKEMFETGHDDELVEAMKKVEDFVYHGCILAGKASELKEITGHLKLYR